MFREQRRNPCVGRGEKTEDVTCGRKQGIGNRTGTVYPGYPQDKEINGERKNGTQDNDRRTCII